jgi:type 1 glutamine amidotransferase
MLCCLLATCVLHLAPPAEQPGVLVFSRTAGYRHGSIAEGQELFKSLGEDRWRVELTEDPSVFTDKRLSGYDVVVMLQTTGDVLNDEQEDSLERYLRGGGGLVGIHAAADGERDWPFFGSHILGGSWFKSHPAIQNATVVVEDAHHPSTQHLAARWPRTDEWYNYVQSPRPGVHVLASLDESSYEGGEMGADHPIAWSTTIGKGAAFYTGLGHTAESYTEQAFRDHIRGGVEWAMADGWIDLGHDWQHRAGWQDVAGAEVDGRDLKPLPGIGSIANGSKGHAGDLVTGGSFGDCELHIEFMIPEGSNSGVYLQGRYEIQILDSCGVTNPGAGDCGGIYERWDELRSPKGFEGVAPNENASAPPGEWQTYDIVFQAPQFDTHGEKVRNARFKSVRHNGVLIHKDIELTGPTRGGSEPEVAQGPLRLQGDHGPVVYRNVKLRRAEVGDADSQTGAGLTAGSLSP